MNKTKAIICTSSMTLMLVIIMAGLALLRYWLALLVLVGFFAALGMAMASGKLYDWLAGETREAEDVPNVFAADTNWYNADNLRLVPMDGKNVACPALEIDGQDDLDAIIAQVKEEA